MSCASLAITVALATGAIGPAGASSRDVRPEKAIGVKTDVAGALGIEAPQAALPEVYQGAVLEHRFRFRNHGSRPVLIEEGVALSGTGTVEFHPARVAPGATGEILVRQPVGDRLGRIAFRFALITDEPGVARYRMGLTSFVESAYDPERPSLEFGTLDKGASRTVAVEILSREVERLEVLEVLDGPPYIRFDSSARAGLSAEGVRLSGTIDTGQVPLGGSHGTLRLRTNVPTQPECLVGYSVKLLGDVVASVDVLRLPLMRVGDEGAVEMTLASRAGRALGAVSIEDPENRVSSEILACPGDPPSPACRRVRVKHKAVERGPFSGLLSIRVDGQPEPLRVTYSGVVISKNARVKDMDLSQLEGQEGGLSTDVPPPVAPTEPPSPAAEAATRPSGGVTLQWKTRRESGTYGYLVYRSDHPGGPFLRASRDIIEAEGGSGEDVRTYSFTDSAVEPGRTYYYYLDAVDSGGLKKRFSGVKARQVATPAE